MTETTHRWASWLWAPLIAVQFLTRIPIRCVPDWAYEEGHGQRRALVFFPWVGLIVGGLGALAWAAAHALRLPPLAQAVVTVAITAAVTGAFHEDGIADTFDALGPHDRTRALEVMRDSRIGTFGAVALWTLLTLKVSALMALPPPTLWRVLVSAHVLARWSALPLSLALPYARDTAGLGAGIARLVSWREVALASLLTALALFGLLTPSLTLLLVVVAVVVTFFTGLFYRAHFGGVTGDCLGATNQIVETMILLAATLPIFSH